MSKETLGRFTRATAEAEHEKRAAETRLHELEHHTIPLLEAERDELRRKLGGREPTPPVVSNLPPLCAQLTETVTVREGNLLRGSLVTTDHDIAQSGRATLVSGATFEMLREEGFAR